MRSFTNLWTFVGAETVACLILFGLWAYFSLHILVFIFTLSVIAAKMNLAIHYLFCFCFANLH